MAAERTVRIDLVGVLSVSAVGSWVVERFRVIAAAVVVVAAGKFFCGVDSAVFVEDLPDFAVTMGDGREVEAEEDLPFVVRVLAALATLVPLPVRSRCFDATGVGALLGVAEREVDPLAAPALGDAADAGALEAVELGEATALASAVDADRAVVGDDAEEVEDNDRCPLTTDVLAALRFNTAARIWIDPASLSPSSAFANLLLGVGEAVLVPCEDEADPVLNLLPCVGVAAACDPPLATELVRLPGAIGAFPNSRLGGLAIAPFFGASCSTRTKSPVDTSSSSAISFEHHFSSLLNPPSARTLIHLFLR